MTFASYNNLYNFIWYQSIWFIAVLGGTDWMWLLTLLLLTHIALVKDKKAEVMIMIAGATVGFSIEIGLSLAGLYSFTVEPQLLPVPLWLLVLWMGFCGTLRHSLKFMVNKPKLMVILAGLFAPLSYLAAMRLGAVEFPLGNWMSAAIIGASWVIGLPLILYLNSLVCKFVDYGENRNSSTVSVS